jgi:hypothetical protein
MLLEALASGDPRRLALDREKAQCSPLRDVRLL